MKRITQPQLDNQAIRRRRLLRKKAFPDGIDLPCLIAGSCDRWGRPD
jgi:hypothetical protein